METSKVVRTKASRVFTPQPEQTTQCKTGIFHFFGEGEQGESELVRYFFSEIYLYVFMINWWLGFQSWSQIIKVDACRPSALRGTDSEHGNINSILNI